MVPVTLQPRRAPQRDGLVERGPRGGHLRRANTGTGTRERLRVTSWPGCAIDRPNDPASTLAWPAVCGPGWRTGPARWSARGGTRTAAPPRAPTALGSRGPEVAVAPGRRRAEVSLPEPGRHLVSGPRPLPPARHHRFGGRPTHRRARRARPPPESSRPGPPRRPSGSSGPIRAAGPSWPTRSGTCVASLPASPRAGCPAPTTASPFPWPADGWCCAGCSTCWSGAPGARPGHTVRAATHLGGPWALARTALHYLALLETLRHGNPPFRLGLLDSAVGRYVIEDVRQEHLRAMASHLVTRPLASHG